MENILVIKKKIEHSCSECNTTWHSKPNVTLTSKVWYPYCAELSTINSNIEFIGSYVNTDSET